MDVRLGIVGLGYVGLPLAIEFAKIYEVIGFDIDENRIEQLAVGIDWTREANLEDLKHVHNIHGKKEGLVFTANIKDLRNCSVYIITVPTPVDQFNSPNLQPLLSASKMIGSVLKKNDIVIYESTVYPGCTEEECIPILEQESGLLFNRDFFCGYSPERISPGDKVNTLVNVKKVTSGSTPESAEFIDNLYSSIIKAGTHLAPSIKVAEASKAIENAQRDINISFVNELALIFDRMGIDTTDVLNAASTKWNFLNFKPGLVGGHCISVDPYYFAHKAEKLGYKPEVILSGRRVNNEMGSFVANKVFNMMQQKAVDLKTATVLLLGITFKENCPDIRNSRVIDIYNKLIELNLKVDIYDPLVNQNDVEETLGVKMINSIYNKKYASIILAVAHEKFLEIDFFELKRNGAIIFDVKSFLDRNLIDARL